MSRWTPNYHTACSIQRKILAMMDRKILNDELSPAELSSLATSWERLEERKRILRMKPLPKAMDVTPKAKERQPLTFRE